MKYILLVLDGMGDIGEKTPLEIAKKPNIDMLAKNGAVGLLDLGYKKSKFSDSDIGYLKLLSSFSDENYPGRGYLEALGIGLKPKKFDICLRGNFATLNSEGNIVDRRAGRDETGLEKFAEELNMEIDGINFTVRKSTGHRLVAVLSGEGLSDEILPNDTKEENVPLKQIQTKSGKGKFTASVLNKFLYKANKILSADPLNKKRKIPANAILIRNIGRKAEITSFEKTFGLKGCCISGIPIAKGVSKFLGLDLIEDESFTGMPDTNFSGKFEAAERSLKKYDFVFLHFNGSDILSHDGKRDEKTQFIEKVDFELGKFLKNIKLDETKIAITCDHRTCSLKNYKSYRHLPDPVPFLISGVEKTGNLDFNEKTCEKGIRKKGNSFIPLLLS